MSDTTTQAKPCFICSEPTTQGAEVDKGEGWTRHAICSVECFNAFVEVTGSSPSPIRHRFPV